MQQLGIKVEFNKPKISEHILWSVISNTIDVHYKKDLKKIN